MNLKVAFLNCESCGDCIVVTFYENGKKACIVVDGGNDKKSAKALFDYLSKENISTINLMVGTHIDQDHIQGLYRFVEAENKKKEKNKPFINIKEYWGPKPTEDLSYNISPTILTEGDSDEEAEGDSDYWQRYIIKSVRQNDKLTSSLRKYGVRKILHPSLDEPPRINNLFKSVKIDLLGPDTQIYANKIKKNVLAAGLNRIEDIEITSYEELEGAVTRNYEQLALEAKRNANNQSIVFRLTPATGSTKAKKWSFLLTGDAEEEAWEKMLENGGSLSARVLKIPHHGSKNGITKDGLSAVKPKYCVNFNAGTRHDIPNSDILKKIQKTTREILCTRSNKNEDACKNIPPNKCPAIVKPETIIFEVDLNNGECSITPENRRCKHNWETP